MKQIVHFFVFFFSIFFSGIAGVLLPVKSSQAKVEKEIVFAVHPYLPVIEIYKRFTTLVDYLAEAVKENVYYKYRDRGLKAFATSNPVPSHPFVGRSDLAPALVQKIRESLMDLNNTPEGLFNTSVNTKGHNWPCVGRRQ